MKPLPIFNPSLSGALGSLPQQLTQFFTPRPQGEGPYDGRTVDDFKPYLVALNLTKRCRVPRARVRMTDGPWTTSSPISSR